MWWRKSIRVKMAAAAVPVGAASSRYNRFVLEAASVATALPLAALFLNIVNAL